MSNDDNKAQIDQIKDGKVLTERSCTDCCMIIVAAAFVVGWIVIISVAAALGDPARIIRPSNFDNELCGDPKLNGGRLANYPYAFFPRPSRTSYGLCVAKCPAVGDYVCNARSERIVGGTALQYNNEYYNHNSAEYKRGASAYAKCLLKQCNSTELAWADKWVGLNKRVTDYGCFFVFYSTGSTLFRCLPGQQTASDNATVAEQVGESAATLRTLSEYTGAASFFARGFSEMYQAWPVILICSFTCMVLSLLWLFLLRWILAPLVYLCILLILVLLIVIGYLAMLMADDLEKVKLPGDTATDDQLKLWRALQYAAWLLAAMYVIVMFWMIKRIKIAICIMKQGSKAFLATPSMTVVPPITFLLVIGWTAFFIVTAVYIQTVGELKSSSFRDAANSNFGATAVNDTEWAAQTASARASPYTSTNTTSNSTLNTSTWSQDDRVKIMHAYNFFGYLWVSAFCIMFGYFCMCMSVVAYYFSATQEDMRFAESTQADERERGKVKATPPLVILRSFWIALRYHLGTVLFGSLLIAIIQFIRVLAIYLEEQFLSEWKEVATVKILICCIDCCLACIERCIKIISKNAFIITAIKNTWFCTSAGQAMGILMSNAARVSILGTLAAVACFVLKVFIVGCNMIIAWGLINVQALTDNRKVESGLFPLFGILILSFIIATLFVNVYECCVDTMMMSFLIDESDLGGMFLDAELAELLGMFKDAEEARINYEKSLRNATDGKKVESNPTEPTPPTKN